MSGSSAPGSLAKPGASNALGLGNFAGSHLFGNLGTAVLPFLATGERSKIEPFVRLNKIDAYAASTATIGNTEIIARLRVATGRVSHPAFNQKTSTFHVACHFEPLWSVRTAVQHARLTKWLTHTATSLPLSARAQRNGKFQRLTGTLSISRVPPMRAAASNLAGVPSDSRGAKVAASRSST
jgi:hypothetical protein